MQGGLASLSGECHVGRDLEGKLPAIARLQDLARREPSFHCISCNNWVGSNVEKVRESTFENLAARVDPEAGMR